jgi:hypothetical protein
MSHSAVPVEARTLHSSADLLPACYKQPSTAKPLLLAKGWKISLACSFLKGGFMLAVVCSGTRLHG